jgi:hypothetical protein
MDRPLIVIRDIHRYGDDLTVPEAIGRLCGTAARSPLP